MYLILSEYIKKMIGSQDQGWIRILTIAGGLTWLVFFIGGLLSFPGSKLLYSLFSFVFLLMLISGLYRQVRYGYLFLTVFLWLGFWIKLTVHSIFGYQFIEPVGAFTGTVSAWNDVLWVAIMAALGVVGARCLYGILPGSVSTMIKNKCASTCPQWYPAVRKSLWIMMMLIIITVTIFNVVFGVHQIGLVPRTIFGWHLNAMISWVLNMGGAMGIATLVWWDISLGKKISISVYSILTEGFLSSVSVLSRGTFIYHVIPQFFAIVKNRFSIKSYSFLQIFFVAVAFIGLFIFSQSAVNTLRSFLFERSYSFSSKVQVKQVRLEVINGEILKLQGLVSENVGKLDKIVDMQVLKKLRLEIKRLNDHISILQKEKEQLERDLSEQRREWEQLSQTWSGEALMIVDEFVYQLGGGIYGKVARLAVDRWLGLEGVMAVQAYPQKGMAFLWKGLIEKRENGKVTAYQEISKSHYRTASKLFQFGSLPGAAGFLYYSGSIWAVMFGMVLLTFALFLSESLVSVMTANPILCSLVGFSVANTVAQFGVTPRQDIPYYLMIFSGILIISIFQSRFFFMVLKKLGFGKSIAFDSVYPARSRKGEDLSDA